MRVPHRMKVRTWLRFLEGDYRQMARDRNMSPDQVISTSLRRMKRCLELGVDHGDIVHLGLDNPFADHYAWRFLVNERMRNEKFHAARSKR